MSYLLTKQMEVKVDLPFVFWYSDIPISEDIEKINGCFFKSFDKLKEGEQISLSTERIGCMGGIWCLLRMRPK